MMFISVANLVTSRTISELGIWACLVEMVLKKFIVVAPFTGLNTEFQEDDKLNWAPASMAYYPQLQCDHLLLAPLSLIFLL